jgi:hypothetical protein
MMIDVIGVRPVGGHKLEVEFSDGTVGVRDFISVKAKTGPMSEPLKDPAYFATVFIEDGALTWPNGYDWDPIALHDEMKQAGLFAARRRGRIAATLADPMVRDASLRDAPHHEVGRSHCERSEAIPILSHEIASACWARLAMTACVTHPPSGRR